MPGRNGSPSNPPCPSPDDILAEVRRLAAKRPDGLMTSEQLRRALACDAMQLDAALRELEQRGAIVVAPSVGRVAIVIVVEGDDHALRKSVRLDAFAARMEQEPPPPAPQETAGPGADQDDAAPGRSASADESSRTN